MSSRRYAHVCRTAFQHMLSWTAYSSIGRRVQSTGTALIEENFFHTVTLPVLFTVRWRATRRGAGERDDGRVRDDVGVGAARRGRNDSALCAGE